MDFEGEKRLLILAHQTLPIRIYKQAYIYSIIQETVRIN